MDRPRVDYDRLASAYDARYALDPLQGIEDALLNLASRARYRRILEVGCGTGHWLRVLRSRVTSVYGADASFGMLRAAAGPGPPVVAARANALPFKDGSFDLLYCVNALHHFDDPRAFVEQSKTLLAKPGVLSLIGLDPRLIRRWYLYEYFEGAYERDLHRYPAAGDIVQWMAAAGFGSVDYRTVERRHTAHVGRSVLSDPFLSKQSNSLLALLTDAEYAAGLERIEAAIQQAENSGVEVVFASELPFLMITGFCG